MPKIALNNETIDLVKSGLDLKKRVLRLNLEEYHKRLTNFESRYKMSTRQFLQRFNSGQLGDEQHLFDWLFAYQACKEFSNKLHLLKQVKL